MTPATLERIDAVVTAAARRLFDSYGLDLGEAVARGIGREGEGHDTLDGPEDHDLAASIGFTSALAHGALVVATSRPVVARTYPLGIRAEAPTPRQVCDWAGELTNQLLGRVKNALVSFGLVLDQGTPTVVTGKHLHRAPASTTIARRYSFATECGTVLVYLDAAFAEGFTLREADESAQAVAEGDVRMF